AWMAPEVIRNEPCSEKVDAWMAPEVIRNEPCSEKVDILIICQSFGVVLWELMNCEIPYRDVDSSAIIWGVGNSSLTLPVATKCFPEGFQLLMKQCWNAKARNRPSFKNIIMHIEIAANELVNIEPDEYFKLQIDWREEIQYNEFNESQSITLLHILSFGVVLWELMNCEIPYRDVDSSAIIWGVGNSSLTLPVATKCFPEGFQLLMKQCWNAKARNRPSFKNIIMHIEIAANELVNIEPD
ncbi:unnamed protein product, partial [Medioppia subpectinata]